MKFRHMLVQKISRAKTLRTKFAVVGVCAGKVDVFDVLVDGSGLSKHLAAQRAPVARPVRLHPVDVAGETRPRRF